MITFEDFLAVDIRVGTVQTVECFPEARKPAYILTIDFGEDIGIKKTSAQITDLYTPDVLIGQSVCAVVNFPPKQIGPHISEVLVLGFESGSGISLIRPMHKVPNGARLH